MVKRDRHMQLINPAIYDQVAQQRTKDIELSTEQRRMQRSMKEKAKLSKHFQTIPQPGQTPTGMQNATATQSYEVEVDHIRFRVADGGSKLIRISSTWNNGAIWVPHRSKLSADDPNTARSTPKQAKVGGVTFLRSKNGNLYRSGLIKTKQYVRTGGLLRRQTDVDAGTSLSRRSTSLVQGSLPLVGPFPPHRWINATIRFVYLESALTQHTGTCAKGPQCRYVHDPNRVAICKDYLLRGNCALGDGCDLSHDPTPNRVPACLHFLRGNCTNDGCRYAHIRVNPSGPVCRAFGTLGYCERGSDCAERHVFECPDYANHAVCRNSKCRLPHVDRAGQIRKATAAQAANAELGSPDLSSDDEYDEIDSDDVDSEDEIEEDVLMQGADNHGSELSQQQDYVSF